MRLQTVALVCVLGLSVALPAREAQTPPQTPAPAGKSHRLEALTWQEAERVLTPETVVLIPLGAGSKEHGPHLKLRNDLTLAEYLTTRVADATAVVVAPTLTYHFYPAFLEYPGSTSLSLASARDMTAEIVRTLSAYGPRRFYVLNTGVSTVRALDPAVALMASEGVLVRYTNLATRLDPATRGFCRAGGRLARRRGRDLDDALHRSVQRRHEQSGAGLHAVYRWRTPHAAARRHRHVLA